MKSLQALLLVFALGMATSAFAQNTAESLYKSKCQICHGPDGAGNTPAGKKLGTKDFHSPEVKKMSDSELAEITKAGKNKMPAYGKSLSEQQIKDLIKYMRSL